MDNDTDTPSLADLILRIWVDGSEFRWTREQAAAAA
jgi:hypothetical protein